jgi:hypothetical protein
MLIIDSNGAWAFGPLPAGTGNQIPDVPARNTVPNIPNPARTSVPDRASSLGTARSGSIFSSRPFSPLMKDQ